MLTLFGRRLPTALRTFLLTLAVVDDLLGILVIAIFYAEGLALVWLGASAVVIALFGAVVRHRRTPPTVLVALGVTAWCFMHMSGVHATISGVALALTVPARDRGGDGTGTAERFEHRWRPISAGFAVPVFALFAAGFSLSPAALSTAASDPPAQGVALGLLLGKPTGILLATALLVHLTKARLAETVRWLDLAAVSVVAGVAGVGFTVSLLIGNLSFPALSPHHETVKAAVLIGSLASAALGGLLLSWRSRVQLRLRRSPPGTPPETRQNAPS